MLVSGFPVRPRLLRHVSPIEWKNVSSTAKPRLTPPRSRCAILSVYFRTNSVPLHEGEIGDRFAGRIQSVYLIEAGVVVPRLGHHLVMLRHSFSSYGLHSKSGPHGPARHRTLSFRAKYTKQSLAACRTFGVSPFFQRRSFSARNCKHSHMNDLDFRFGVSPTGC